MQWITLGTKLLPLIVMAIHAVEKLVKGQGKEKQDAAVEVIGVGLTALETGLDRELLDNAEVDAAVRAMVDAYVHLQNVVAKTRAAANPTSAYPR